MLSISIELINNTPPLVNNSSFLCSSMKSTTPVLLPLVGSSKARGEILAPLEYKSLMASLELHHSSTDGYTPSLKALTLPPLLIKKS